MLIHVKNDNEERKKRKKYGNENKLKGKRFR